MIVYSYANIRVRMQHSIFRLLQLRGVDRALPEHEPLKHEALLAVLLARPHVLQQRVFVPLDLGGYLLKVLAFIGELALEVPPPEKISRLIFLIIAVCLLIDPLFRFKNVIH